MASIRFAVLVFGFIIVSLALKYSSACAQEGSGRKEKWLPAVASRNHASSRNVGFSAAAAEAEAEAAAGRKGLGGRKMQIHEFLKREIEKKQGSNERQEILGKDDSNKSFKGAEHSRLNTQDDSKLMTGRAKRKSTRRGYSTSSPRNFPNSKPPPDSVHFSADSSQVSSTAPGENHHEINARNDDSKAFLEVADEVVDLMRRDYKDFNRPRRKPPINNREPTN